MKLFQPVGKERIRRESERERDDKGRGKEKYRSRRLATVTDIYIYNRLGITSLRVKEDLPQGSL